MINEMAVSAQVSGEEVAAVLTQMSSVFRSITAISSRCAIQGAGPPPLRTANAVPERFAMSPSVAPGVANDAMMTEVSDMPPPDPRQRHLDFTVAAAPLQQQQQQQQQGLALV